MSWNPRRPWGRVYLDDAAIDDSAFRSIFGASVRHCAQFFRAVELEGLNFERPEDLQL